jgi:hypothetical protein
MSPRQMTTWHLVILAGPLHQPRHQGAAWNNLHVALPVQEGSDVAPTWHPHGTTSEYPNACF